MSHHSFEGDAARSSQRGRPGVRLANVLLLVVSTGLTLAALECGLRLGHWRSERRAIAALASSERPTVAPGTRVDLRDIIVPSRHPDVVFKLQANLRAVRFCRGSVSTNSRGFRSAELTPRKRPGTVRIVGIGDSVMFGWGVNDGEDYLAQLGAGLARRAPETRWEVVNTAVPGYNTVMEVATLERRALDLAPDVVVYGYCINDSELPRFLQRTGDHLALGRSYLLDFVRQRRLRGHRPDAGDLAGLVESPVRRPSELVDPASVPAEYAHMVGSDAHERALDRLLALSREHGFRVVVVIHPPLPPDGDRQFEKRGFAVVHTQPYIDGHLAAHRDDPTAMDSLVVGKPCSGKGWDLHPSARAHGLIAEALLDHFESALHLRLPARVATDL